VAGFALVLYANAALQGAIAGMRTALQQLSRAGVLEEDSDLVAGFAERQALVRKPFYDDLEARLAASPAGADAEA
jgi:2-methylisocitrate lyase-like PEP mutase family enzyme